MALLSPQQRRQLVLENMSLAHKFASRYYRHSRYKDIHQASFLGLCEAAKGWDPEKGSSFSSWAHNWMRAEVNRSLGDSGKEIPLTDSVPETEATIDTDSESAALLELMHKLVGELPEDQQHVILLKYSLLDQCSQSYNDKQIAAMLDVSATWVRALRKRAFASLREKIERLKIR